MMRLTRRLRALRLKARLSQVDLAKRVGVSQPYLHQLERGTRRNPSLQVLAGLARALGVDVGALLDGGRR